MKKVLTIGVLLGALVLAGCSFPPTVSTSTTGDQTQMSGTMTSGSVDSGTATARSVVDASGNYLGEIAVDKTSTLTFRYPERAGGVKFYVPLFSGDTLHIKVQPQMMKEGVALRLNQIGMPDDSMDGPFSADQDYTAQQSGQYLFIVGEDLMAAYEPYSGKVDVQLQMK